MSGLAVQACSASTNGQRMGQGASPSDALELGRAIDMVPAAGLVWLVEMNPRDLLSRSALGPAVAMIVPEARFDAFARRRGGLDLRRADQIVIAAYPKATLVVARVPFEPGRVDAAFVALGGAEQGRTVEHGVTRMWRNVKGEHEEVALLAGKALIVERGQLGLLRAAVYFAEGRLRRSLPVLRAEPLASAASMVGEAPLRAFAPGPFEGEWARGLAGLLRATTAVAFSMRPVAHPTHSALTLRILLTGAWGRDATAAGERLRSAFGVLMADPVGLLTGIDHPLEGPTVTADAGALTLDVTLDALAAARGVHSMADASIAEIMAY